MSIQLSSEKLAISPVKQSDIQHVESLYRVIFRQQALIEALRSDIKQMNTQFEARLTALGG